MAQGFLISKSITFTNVPLEPSLVNTTTRRNGAAVGFLIVSPPEAN
mgnify:CR=1 FL=1